MKLHLTCWSLLYPSILVSSGCGGDAAESAGTDVAGDATQTGDTRSGDTATDVAIETDVQGATSQVVTQDGPLIGAVSGATRAFLGVPYAAPPVGALRWRPPQAHAPWSAPRDATQRGERCPQLDEDTGQLVGDEDCLTLNLWAPTTASDAPVMVWLHGGGYAVGGGGEPQYDGQLLSETTGAIVVTLNYRLGALGFMALPALAAEDAAHPSTGNYGFEDQRAALEWVHDNVLAFGGDPANVTLFGESAGGHSVCLHMFSPRSGGLFHRVIIESAGCSAPPSAEHEGPSSEIVAKLDCDTQADVLACLRGKSVAELMDAMPGVGGGPVVDGWNLMADPLASLNAGEIANQVPVLMGTNRDEADFSFGMGFLPPVANANVYAGLIGYVFGDAAPAVLAEYPVESYPDAQHAASVLFTDARFVCPTRRVARALVAADVPVYLYSFAHAPVSPVFPGAGAFHSAEVAFVFGSSMWGIELDAPEKALSASMMGYWGRMAMSGDPNGGEALAWPLFDAGDKNLVLDLEQSTMTGLRGDKCDFWDTLE